MRISFLSGSFIILIGILISYNAFAETTCAISEGKKALIKEALCGKFSSELSYKDSSDGCFKIILEKRALDTASQINALRLCGYTDLAERLKNASLKIMSYTVPLSKCIGYSFSPEFLMSEAQKSFDERAKGQMCSPKLRGMLNERLDYFNKVVEAIESGSGSMDFSTLGVIVDTSGNVSEK